MSEGQHTALAAAWPSMTHWQRDFEAHVQVQRKASASFTRSVVFLTGKRGRVDRTPTMMPDPKRLTLEARELVPVVSHVELERLLAAHPSARARVS